MNGQVSLEALLVFAGVLSLVGAFWVGTQGVRDAALEGVQELSSEAAFERVRFSVRAASVMPSGFWHEERFSLPRNVSVSWTESLLTWSSAWGDQTLSAFFEGAGQADLESGVHEISVRKNRGVWVAFS